MILGLVLAGGQSRRFGEDKALVEIDGQTLLSRAIDQLSPWCEMVVVAGRAEAPAPTIPDWPQAGLGPLGGLAAGLRYAADADFASVLSVPVDSPRLPEDLCAQLSPAPAYLAEQPVIGHWPVEAVAMIEDILRGQGRHSMLAFAERLSARAVTGAGSLPNINTRADLAAFSDPTG